MKVISRIPIQKEFLGGFSSATPYIVDPLVSLILISTAFILSLPHNSYAYWLRTGFPLYSKNPFNLSNVCISFLCPRGWLIYNTWGKGNVSQYSDVHLLILLLQRPRINWSAHLSDYPFGQSLARLNIEKQWSQFYTQCAIKAYMWSLPPWSCCHKQFRCTPLSRKQQPCCPKVWPDG